MALIQVTPELLNEKAKELRGLRSDHDDAMKRMGTLIHGLDSIWKGEAQTAFVAKYDSMQGTFNDFSEMLEEYAKMMEVSAQKLQDTDVALKSSMS